MRAILTNTSMLCCLAWAIASAPPARAASGCQNLSGTPINFNPSWLYDIKPIFNDLLGGRCTSCHGTNGSAGLDLGDANVDAIYKIVGSAVQPGDPLGSVLFIKINCSEPDSGSQMPLAGALLSTEQRELIYDWIAQGARGDYEPGGPNGNGEDPQEPVFRNFMFRDGAESIR